MRLRDSVIEHRIDVDRNVVLGNDRLAWKVQDLLAKIDSRRSPGGDSLHASDIRLSVADIDRAGLLEERDQDVESRSGYAMEATETLDDQNFRLTDDLERLA